MFTVAWLSAATRDPRRDWNPYPAWRKLASDVEFRPLWVDPARAAPLEEPREFIRKADAFYLRDGSLIGNPELSDEIAAQISLGKRLVAELNPGTQEALDALNRFLGRYGIKGSLIGILRRDEAAPDHSGVFFPDHDQPDLFELIQHVHGACFRDPVLFNSVDSLKLRSPRLIEYTGRARPTLVVPEASSGLIDISKDWPSDWTASELACIASHYEPDSSGAVLAFSGFAFTDALLEFNQSFARNLIKWLRASAKNELRPFDLVHQIETNLLITLKSVLGSDFDLWWRQAVPVPIRIECSKRQEQAKSVLPKQAFLDLLDYKKIIEANWAEFEPVLKRVGWQGGKQKALAWFDRLNEIRNTVAHPTRAYFSGPLSPEDHKFLEECLTRILTMSQHRNVDSD